MYCHPQTDQSVNDRIDTIFLHIFILCNVISRSLLYRRNDTTLTDLKVSLFHSNVNICVPDKLQRSPLKPSIQPYVQFPSNMSHIMLIHVSQCVPVLHSAKRKKIQTNK